MSQTVTETPFDLTELVNQLVTEDDEPVDNTFSEKEQRLLTETLYSSWTPPTGDDEPKNEPRPFWASANVGLYTSVHQPPLVPDVFVSLDVSVPADMHEKQGRTYLAWEHGKVPEVVVEIVSNREGGELDRKLREYARAGVRYYVVHDPRRLLSGDELRVYEPGLAGRYRLRPDYKLPDVGLSLTLWRGSFEGAEETWLRWCDAEGRLLPTPDERAAHAEERAAQAEARATEAEERAAREVAARAEAEARAAQLAAKLRALGVNPEQP
jgi:Uma2 family endonuclease